MTWAAIAYRVHASAGGSGETAGADLLGSRTPQICWREDRAPVGRPATRGELAKAATSTGPRAWAVRQRRVRAAASPRSRLTWTDAVAHIMVRPAPPSPSK